MIKLDYFNTLIWLADFWQNQSVYLRTGPYRYLAIEGFLPGYNFPRLPLYAYVPSGSGKGSAAYLQRARFLAIAEFGPRSLVYHEGRAYRVYKAKLPPNVKDSEGRLATSTMYVCTMCGAGHEIHLERCHSCSASMAGCQAIPHVFRIDNVETKVQERITANDEDRQRQGFDIQTVFAWPRRDGAIDVMRAGIADTDGSAGQIDYATGTTISRLNKGLRRRAIKANLGFWIDPANGNWVAEDDDDNQDDRATRTIRPQPIVPIVQDHKNAALLRLAGEHFSQTSMATIQHALTRGLELCFQVEEGEVLVEPTPSRDDRRALLAYEASEGGAGVLGRLASEPGMLAEVARKALELMHYEGLDAAIAAADPAQLHETPGADCVRGCYRCLLSYYNQPDHELIDRTDDVARRVLLRWARSTITLQPKASSGSWRDAMAKWGAPRPDDASITLSGVTLPLAWRGHLVAAGPPDGMAAAQAAAAAQGYTLFGVSPEPGDDPPPGLLEALGVVL